MRNMNDTDSRVMAKGRPPRKINTATGYTSAEMEDDQRRYRKMVDTCRDPSDVRFFISSLYYMNLWIKPALLPENTERRKMYRDYAKNRGGVA